MFNKELKKSIRVLDDELCRQMSLNKDLSNGLHILKDKFNALLDYLQLDCKDNPSPASNYPELMGGYKVKTSFTEPDYTFTKKPLKCDKCGK